MTNYHVMLLVSDYELCCGNRLNTQLIRISRTREGVLIVALLCALETGSPLPELTEYARLAPVTGRARFRLRQTRYQRVPGNRG